MFYQKKHRIDANITEGAFLEYKKSSPLYFLFLLFAYLLLMLFR